MYQEPDLLLFGGTTRDDALIQWVSDDFGFDVDSVDTGSLTKAWTVDAGNNFDIIPGDVGDGYQLRVREDIVGVSGDLSVGGNYTDMTIDATEPIQLDGFTTLSIRRSSDNTDEIAEIVRHDQEDYDVHLFQSGSAERVYTTGDDNIDAATLDGDGPDAYAVLAENETVAGDWDHTGALTVGGESVATETWATGEFAAETHDNSAHSIAFAEQSYVDDALVDISNDGAEVDTNVAAINFTTDLGVTSTSEGVDIEFVGAQVPSDVYQDGTLTVEDANGIDFLNDFTVATGTNDVAEITLDVPDDLASTSSAETVTAVWNVDTGSGGDLTIGGEAIATESYADSAGFSGSYGDLTNVPSTFTPEEHGDNVHTEDYLLEDTAATVTESWAFDANTAFGSSHITYDGSWRHRYSSSIGAFVFEQDGTVVAQLNDDGTVGVPNSLTVGGETAATETYVDSNVFSGSYDDLTDVPSTFAPEEHGDSAHSVTYAEQSYVDNNFVDQSYVDSNFVESDTNGFDIGGDTGDLGRIGGTGNDDQWFWVRDSSSNGNRIGHEASEGLRLESTSYGVTLATGAQNGFTSGTDALTAENGSVTVHNSLTVDGDDAVVGDDTYKIVKNGPDGNGYINFKT